MEHSMMFGVLKERYEKNFVRKDQLQQYVKLGKLYDWEHQEITGESYQV